MGDKELACVGKFGRPLTGGVQVVRSCTIPGHSRATIRCKVDGGHISSLRVVESTHTRIQLARSLNRLTRRGDILVQCVNPFPEAINLPSGSTLGRFQEEIAGRHGERWRRVLGSACFKAGGPPHPTPHTNLGCVADTGMAVWATESAEVWPSCYTGTMMHPTLEIMTAA